MRACVLGLGFTVTTVTTVTGGWNIGALESELINALAQVAKSVA